MTEAGLRFSHLRDGLFTGALPGENGGSRRDVELDLRLALVSRRLDTLEMKLIELDGLAEWSRRRLDEIEYVPSPLRLRETSGRSGIRLRFAEFSNTIARFLRPRNRISCDDESLDKDFEKRRERLCSLVQGFPASDSSRRRVFVDMTYALSVEFTSGIQRAVNEFVRAGLEEAAVTPVFLDSDGGVFGLNESGEFGRVSMRSGDALLCPDASWHYLNALKSAMRKNSLIGVTNVVILYDLFPIRFADSFRDDLVQRFACWVDQCLLESDGVICATKAVADDLSRFLMNKRCRLKRIGWSHLGHDYRPKADAKRSVAVTSILRSLSRTPFFLTVATLEPRKDYITALNAMERLWELGHQASYVMVGRYGWSQHAVVQRLGAHPEYGRRLFWIESASDADLRDLYADARALIYPSLAEGFGLPLIEAAYAGLPAIVSEIPAFREIAGNAAEYFEVGDFRALADLLAAHLLKPKSAPEIHALSWRESMRLTLSIIHDGSYQYKLGPESIGR